MNINKSIRSISEKSSGERFREIRSSLGFTLREFSKYLGYSSLTCLRGWESGEVKLSAQQRETLHNDGMNLLYIDVGEGDYFRDGFSHPVVRENVLKRVMS